MNGPANDNQQFELSPKTVVDYEKVLGMQHGHNLVCTWETSSWLPYKMSVGEGKTNGREFGL